MNIDNPDNYRELNTHVENYVMAEFVAVPPSFNIESHLSMREQVGIFSIKDINLKQVKIISDAVTHSSVFSSMNNAILHPKSCMFFLQLLNELNLVLNKVDNPLRRSREEYIKFAEHWEDNRQNYIRGQHVDRISFVIVNVVHFLNQSIIDEAWKAIQELEIYQKEINETTFKVS